MAAPPKKFIDDSRGLDDNAVNINTHSPRHIPITGGDFKVWFQLAPGTTIKQLGSAVVTTGVDPSDKNTTIGLFDIGVLDGVKDNDEINRGAAGYGYNADLAFKQGGFELDNSVGKVAITNLSYREFNAFAAGDDVVFYGDVSINGAKAVNMALFRPDYDKAQLLNSGLLENIDKALGTSLGVDGSNVSPIGSYNLNVDYAPYAATWDLESLRPYLPAGAIPVQAPVTKPTAIVGGLTTLTLTNFLSGITPMDSEPDTLKVSGAALDTNGNVDTIRLSEIWGSVSPDGDILHHTGSINFVYAFNPDHPTNDLALQDLVADTRSGVISAELLNGSLKHFHITDAFDIAKDGTTLTLGKDLSDYLIQSNYVVTAPASLTAGTVIGTVSFAPVTTLPSYDTALAIHQFYSETLTN